MTRIILASASVVRSRLLSAAGVQFETVPARIDEEMVKESLSADGAGPRQIAEHLAELKAIKVSASQSGALVVGADQLLSFRDEIISKSATIDEARALLQRLAGHAHELVSALALAKDGAVVWRYCDQAHLKMRNLSSAFLDDYLAKEGRGVLDSVGCYHYEGRGAQLFSAVSGDYFSILGLPLLPLLAALREFGAVGT